MRTIAPLPLIALMSLCAALACEKPAPKRTLTYHNLIGFVDSPAAEGTVGPVFLVAGWALGRQGVDRVRIYLDDEMVGNAEINVPRPDLDKQFPQYAGSGPNHGFTVNVDAGTRSGYRALRIEAIDRAGARAHVASINVKIEP